MLVIELVKYVIKYLSKYTYRVLVSSLLLKTKFNALKTAKAIIPTTIPNYLR
jgi:hypothetical protein